MRKRDKLKNYEQANLMLEQSYLKSKGLLKEDILELKQMAKQIYSFLKKKGYNVKIRTEKGDERSKGFSTKIDLSDEAQLIAQEVTEIVWVVIPVHAAVKIMLDIKPEERHSSAWEIKAEKKFGSRDHYDWIKNKEVINYMNQLGNELVGQLKSRYPNMVHQFSQEIEKLFYTMRFGYEKTKKGGNVDQERKQKNVPKPEGQQ